jgi:3-dehydroquinate dehydratase/shikimate dehydrogenase
MTKICLCLTGKTIARDLELIDKYRSYIDIAELRVDCLNDDEHEYVRRFPELAGIPIVLTVRRQSDGGIFKSGESARIVLLSKALAFAHPDARRNFAYVDLEADLDVPGLEDVARAYNTRIIRSVHDFDGSRTNLLKLAESLYHVGDEIAKIAVHVKTVDELCNIIEIAQSLKGRDKILVSMGDIGQCTRILAGKLGSYITYTSITNDGEIKPAAPGQLDPVELCDLYRFREINQQTQLFGITGYPLHSTGSPPFYNKIFGSQKQNKVYIRFPSETIESFLRLADLLDIRGASVTVPHKEAVLKYLIKQSDEVTQVGACNTIVRTGGGWSGYNTDTHGFQISLLNLTGKKDLRRMKCTVIGAGGAAHAICCVIKRLKGKALILNRDLYRARALAAPYKFQYAALDEDGARMAKKYSDIIIQTTSVGGEADIDKDPIPWYRFKGSEYVIDIVYKPAKTRFLQRALQAGCKAINGELMLHHQARAQYKCFFAEECPAGG